MPSRPLSIPNSTKNLVVTPTRPQELGDHAVLAVLAEASQLELGQRFGAGPLPRGFVAPAQLGDRQEDVAVGLHGRQFAGLYL